MPKSWVPTSITLVAGGVGGAAAASLLGAGDLSGWIGASGAVAGGVVGISGLRAARRHELMESVV
ncbi:hypothetical protein [Tessaracoccus timonensis]|uniref:hypothetical protein n=1 Tax=Tessaracoccus timonensis TaxID=2161816 RepID=UPI000D554E90|nr:hypothetical protein [Tessaracoccus timonensis]